MDLTRVKDIDGSMVQRDLVGYNEEQQIRSE
jgi:hypothetical protein